MKRLNMRFFSLSIVSALLLSVTVLPAAAAIPSGYWQYQAPFLEAKNSGDVQAIISSGLSIESVMINEPLDYDKAAILASTYEAMYQSYETLSDYDAAIEYLEKYIPYAEYLGYSDAVKLAERRLDVIDPMTEVYALTENTSQSPYFGAKYEPTAGAYYGRVYSENGYTPTSAESATSVYVEFLTENISDFDYYISDLDDGQHILHVALNMPYENSSLSQVLTADSYINSTMEYLAGLQSPVFLRIGGEMNVWTDLADAATYKAAYIKIAQAAREIAPNVALVFSPNYISNWNVDIEDYYPGDEYVDWVGISAYTNQYRNGFNPVTTEDHNEMYYNAGEYANYITSIKYIVDLYGDKKPIMLTECGSGYATSTGLNLSSFASLHVQQLFTYMNMVYPQIKALIYFDVNLASAGYYYALSSNSTLYSTYLSATNSNPTLLHDLGSSSATYVTAGTYRDSLDTLSLSAYCNPVGDPTVTVTYTLDGSAVQTTSTLPYTYNLDVNGLSYGNHSLVVSFSSSCGYSATKTYSLTKGSDNLVALAEGTTPVDLPQPTVSADPADTDVGQSDYSFSQEEAAMALYEAGIWSGMGTKADGSIDFGLDTLCTREQIVKLLITLLDELDYATADYATVHPFTDINDWASQYVGYAYSKGYASGMTDTTFGGGATNASVAQCLTFILRGLGYSSETDFAWDSPWTLSDSIGLTLGQYSDGDASQSMTRGEIALILYASMSIR